MFRRNSHSSRSLRSSSSYFSVAASRSSSNCDWKLSRSSSSCALRSEQVCSTSATRRFSSESFALRSWQRYRRVYAARRSPNYGCISHYGHERMRQGRIAWNTYLGGVLHTEPNVHFTQDLTELVDGHSFEDHSCDGRLQLASMRSEQLQVGRREGGRRRRERSLVDVQSPHVLRAELDAAQGTLRLGEGLQTPAGGGTSKHQVRAR